MNIAFLLPLLLSAATLPAQAPAQTDLAATVSSTVERARREFDVPGISVAIVKDGRVVFAKGYGVRKLDGAASGSQAVTPQTLFGIASNSKAFTSAALGMLVDNGRLSWDDRVIDRLPEFAMSDAYVTHEMRIRDLLCHRSGLGLGAGDLMFFPRGDLTAEQILYRLRFVPLATSFRSQYAYDNVLYNVAGAVIQKVSGLTWQEFVRENIYQPLGMTSSHTSINEVMAGAGVDVAYPHAPVEGKLTALPLESLALDNVAPAGALVSSAGDLAKWVVMLLNKGESAEGKRILTPRQIRELWTPAVLIPVGDPPPALAETKTNLNAYALGEGIREYRGRLMVSHTGGLLGMVTQVSMIPEEKLGVIVLTNQEAGGAMSAIVNTILDSYLNAPAKDWVAAYSDLAKNRAAAAREAVSKAGAGRNAQSKPSLALASYAGRYRDPWYGDVIVEYSVQNTDGKLTMRFSHSPALTGTLEHFQYDTFIARWNDRSLDADAYVTFTLDADGSVTQVKMKAVSPSTDFSFDFHDLTLKPVRSGIPAWE